jgi:hypothetical protein
MTAPKTTSGQPIAPDILASIAGRELLIHHLGHWPTFHDFEVLSVTLERPVIIGAPPDLRATFFIFDLSQAPDSPGRKQGTAEILFEGIDNLRLEGFNHQNPIMGLSITPSEDPSRGYQVTWIGPAWKNDASFICEGITVLRVIDLNPFQKSLPRL